MINWKPNMINGEFKVDQNFNLIEVIEKPEMFNHLSDEECFTATMDYVRNNQPVEEPVIEE